MAHIYCTYCDEPRLPAFKHCVQCNTPFCGKHLALHDENNKNHILIDSTIAPDEWQCPEHKKLLIYHCNSDSITMCTTCYRSGKHEGHLVESLDTFAARRKDRLRCYIENLKEKQQEKEDDINYLKDHEKAQKEKSEKVRERGCIQLVNIVLQVQTLSNKFVQEIKRMDNDVLQSVTEQTNKLEAGKKELQTEIEHIEELCKKNNYTFLKRLKEAEMNWIIHDDQDNSTITKFKEIPIFQMLHKDLLALADDLIKLMLTDGFPVMKKSKITLDINTAYYKIDITGDLRSAFYTTKRLNREIGSETFQTPHVLSKRSFSSGNHYWEVKVKGTECRIGVAYNNIERKTTRQSEHIGNNERSWGLSVGNNLSVWHNYVKTRIATDSPVRAFGIFLEYEAGRLSFYQLCNPKRRLHTFTNTFKRPLYAAFYVGKDSKVKIKK